VVPWQIIVAEVKLLPTGENKLEGKGDIMHRLAAKLHRAGYLRARLSLVGLS
jgi:hypothetical protein